VTLNESFFTTGKLYRFKAILKPEHIKDSLHHKPPAGGGETPSFEIPLPPLVI
jgi:hypothetical protein